MTVSGPKEGNPFCDQWIKGTFCCKNEKKTVDGFYDGDGTYRVRFMPSFTDEYTDVYKRQLLRRGSTA